MTAEVVNLNKARKVRAKAARSAVAETNRVKFGRTRAERDADHADTERRIGLLDAAKLEG